MRGILKTSIALYLIFFGAHYSYSQVFWTETFGSGCNTGTVANGFASPNGTWTVDAPAANNDANANVWYISAAENGVGVGNCGAGCGANPTLHISGKSSDLGATYLSGGSAATDARATSPIIDCSNQCSIELSFEYIENGDGSNDDLTVWYFDGATWTLLEDTPKTPFGTCSPKGLWANRTISLPSSANNNPDVQIGFHWVNNDDNVGTEPSAAIYNIQLSTNDTQAPTITCPTSQTVNNGTSCDYQITDFTALATVSDNCGTPTITQNPAIGTSIGSGIHTVELTATDPSGNVATCSFVLTVYESQAPSITCPNDVVTCEPVVTYAPPVAVDNCPGTTITQFDVSGFTSGDTFPLGITMQGYQVVDASGNVTSCSFNVEVLESPGVAEITSVSGQLCEQKNVTLTANPAVSGVGKWTVIEGSALLVDQFASTTGANNLSYGLNTFVWTISTSSCGNTSDTLTYEVFSNPSNAKTQDELTVCSDTLVSIIATSPFVGVGTWSDVNGTASFVDSMAPNTILYNLSEGWNEIVWTVTSGNCPSSKDTVNVFRKQNTRIYSNDSTVCLVNDGFQLIGSPTAKGVSSVWYGVSGGIEFVNPTSASPTITQINGGDNIIIYAQNHPICGSTADTIIIKGVQCQEYNPLIPTVITPNGDGKNDLFVITSLNVLYPNADVTIVNRWGNLVYRSSGYANPWDGTHMNEGKELPMGTYFYRILLNDNTNKEITGPISIIR